MPTQVMQEKAMEISKNTMVQVSFGVLVCIVVFSVKATNYVRDIKDEIRTGNSTSVEQVKVVRSELGEVQEDVVEVQKSLESVAEKTDRNAEQIKEVSRMAAKNFPDNEEQ